VERAARQAAVQRIPDRGRRRGGEDGTDKQAPVSAVCREKAPRMEGVNQRRKRTSAITPTTHVGRAAWADMWASACGRREASEGWLGQRPSRPVRVAGPKVKKKDF
jgi:hypothetical protein